MSKHDEFCDILADYMPDDYDPNSPIDNDEINTFSLPPVKWSYELSEETLLGKGDVSMVDEIIAEIEKLKNGKNIPEGEEK